MPLTDERASEIRTELDETFSPNEPVKLLDLLRGRSREISRTVEAVDAASVHAVVFGDRGVGKTSIALVTAAVAQEPERARGRRALIVSCSSDDDFVSIWMSVFEEIRTVARTLGFAPTTSLAPNGRLELDPEQLKSPNSVRRAIESLPNPTIVMIDEFDRVSDPATRALMAETIKLFADRGTNSTLVIVGVADDVADLMEAHRSIGRNLYEIQVGPLSQDELAQIVISGLSRAGMSWSHTVPPHIAGLCHGYPYYAHLIGRNAGRAALAVRRNFVELGDVQTAIDDMIENSLQSLRSDYERAIASPQPGNRFRQVLLACAMARKDALGRFAAADVRESLCRIKGQGRHDIPRFQSHLTKFTDPSRGPVLKRLGEPRTYRYRFADPRMVPYVTLRGTASGLISLGDAQSAPTVANEAGSDW